MNPSNSTTWGQGLDRSLRHLVRPPVRLQSDADIARFETGRRGRSNGHGTRPARLAIGAADGVRNLWRIELGRITEFAHDLDHGALAALGRDARRGEKIDALLLIQSPHHHLELRVGKDSTQTEDPGSKRTRAGNSEKERVQCIGRDREIAATIATGNRKSSDGLPARWHEGKVRGIHCLTRARAAEISERMRVALRSSRRKNRSLAWRKIF